MGVACLGLAEYFADEVNRPLHLVDMTRLVSFDDRDGTHHIGGGGDVQDEDFPIFWCCWDGWQGEKVLELLECFGSIVVPLELVGLPKKFDEG